MVRKQASKAVVAQILSVLLDENEPGITAQTIRDDISLKYLVRAIDYVTDQMEI
jgi:hypothetical protein